MKNYLKKDEWCIIEEGLMPEYNCISESVCSIGNGHMGQRANFEEAFSGETLSGSYLAGVYYPDKTRVGWWKNGYPEYFAKVLNAPNWIGIDVKVENETLDLAQCQVSHFLRVLNMKDGYLQRHFTAQLPSGKQLKVDAQRFVSMADKEIGAIRYSIKIENFSGKLSLRPFLDGDVVNKDSNYDEKFWDARHEETSEDEAYITVSTKKTGFVVVTGMKFQVLKNGQVINPNTQPQTRTRYASIDLDIYVTAGDEIILYKYTTNVTSRDYAEGDLLKTAKERISQAFSKGYDLLKKEQAQAWGEIWTHSDIVIEGDVAAQQGIRFNIFQLNQTYTGKDERLNIGPKGFTGEKYGGSTYWDTEAYCLAFYLATADPEVSKNLLVYRYKHLQKAIENAQKLGFEGGAALYPMVTMNGEECHNEWEITFEEIHRNGAIARAIYDYINYTGDKDYLAEYGLEVLLGIARFWAQRINYSEAKKQYVMLGVTGPNEYENNINNNWYTNLMATWCMGYAEDATQWVKKNHPEKYKAFVTKTNFDELRETTKWQDIRANMYFPEDKEKGVFLQQDGYLDKEQILVKDLPAKDLPLNQKWSWDRILRSCFIKQADTLQGIYCFEENYDLETIRRNFEFYEPRTVHESSLSPCVHSILAAKLGMQEKAYQMYLRTSRLDLDDYNNDTEDGCHITSMAGTWMSIVQGFGGMRVRHGILQFSPYIPEQWTSYAFKILYRGVLLNIQVSQEKVKIENQSDTEITLKIHETSHTIDAKQVIEMGLLVA
jgi:maltose phosphorylase